MKFPPFVCFTDNSCCMRYHSKEVGYYRDAGEWNVKAVINNGKVIIKAINWQVKALDGMELIPCTLEEWKKDNSGYIEKLKFKNGKVITYKNSLTHKQRSLDEPAF